MAARRTVLLALGLLATVLCPAWPGVPASGAEGQGKQTSPPVGASGEALPAGAGLGVVSGDELWRWDVTTGRELGRLKDLGPAFMEDGLSADGRFFVAWQRDKHVRVLRDARTGETIRELPTPPDGTSGKRPRFTADG